MKPNPAMIDDENPEWTDEEVAQAKWGYEIFTPEQLASIAIAQQNMRDEYALPLKKRVSLTLDADIIEKFKAAGSDWQFRINQVLKDAQPI